MSSANINSSPAIIHIGDALSVMKSIPSNSIDLCVTSPPYFMQREYGHPDQYGCESTLDLYLKNQMDVFREVHRVLKKTGSVWVVLGDKYDSNQNLIGVPWRFAFAMQDEGWILRNDVIWNKGRALPESVTNRVSRCHEYVFHFSLEKKYYFDHEAIMVAGKESSIPKSVGKSRTPKTPYNYGKIDNKRYDEGLLDDLESGNPYLVRRRSVWDALVIPSDSTKYKHSATFPEKLIEPIILSSCPLGGIVLDPYGGSGTSVVVAQNKNRTGHMIEINPTYADTARKRIEANGHKVRIIHHQRTNLDPSGSG